MEFAEIEALYDSYTEMFQNEWEKIRTINHAIISSQSTKPVKPEDVLSFEWDKDNRKKSSSKKLSKEDRERLMKKVKKQ